MQRLRKKNTLMSLRGNSYGDYGFVLTTGKRRPPERLEEEAEHVAIPTGFYEGRRMGRAGIAGDRTMLPSGLVKPTVDTTPYGTYAVGTGIGAVAAGTTALYAPVSPTVKIILGAISAAMTGGCAYSSVKKISIVAGRDERDKITKISQDWLLRPRPQASLLPRNVIGGELPQQRVDTVKIDGYEKYNRVSEIINFDNFQTKTDYPDWVDSNRVTVGETDLGLKWQKIIYNDNWISRWVINNAMQLEWGRLWNQPGEGDPKTVPKQAYNASFRQTTGMQMFNHAPAPGDIRQDPETGNEIDAFESFTNYGVCQHDTIFEYLGYTGIACMNPPIKSSFPLYYHYVVLSADWDKKSTWRTEEKFVGYTTKNRFINASNFQDQQDDIRNLPSNAIVAGSRSYVINQRTHGGVTDPRMTYDDYMVRQDAVIDQLKNNPEGRTWKWNVVPAHYPDINNYRNRPDFAFMMNPIFPFFVTGGSNSLDLIPWLGTGDTFLEKYIWQELGCNYRWFCFSRDAYARIMFERTYEAQPYEKWSLGSYIFKLVSVVVSVVVAVVGTAMGTGTAGWAAAISIISTVWSIASNVISKYIVGGSGNIVQSVVEGISSLWENDDFSNLFDGVKDRLNDYFGDASYFFKTAYKQVAGTTIGEYAGELEQIQLILRDVSGDIVGGRDYINATMKQYVPNWRDMSDTMARTIQQQVESNILEGRGISGGSIGALDEAKIRIENSVIDKIISADNAILSPSEEVSGLTKLSILF